MDSPSQDSELDSLLAKTYQRLNSLQGKLSELQKLLKQDRNAPCQCGSNRKAKKCCAVPAKANEYTSLFKRYCAILEALA